MLGDVIQKLFILMQENRFKYYFNLKFIKKTALFTKTAAVFQQIELVKTIFINYIN